MASMKSLITVICVIIAILLGWWAFMILKTGTDESHVRISHNLDEQFFDFVEKYGLEKDSLGSHELQHEKKIPMRKLVDVERYHNFTHGMFNPDEYFFERIDSEHFLVYRGMIPPIERRTSESLRQVNYDPTNGIYSDGYHARVIAMKWFR